MNTDRPTLESQIRISKLTDEECIKLLVPKYSISFWLYNHCHLLWRFVYWNWFNSWTEEEGFVLYLKHGFKEWQK